MWLTSVIAAGAYPSPRDELLHLFSLSQTVRIWGTQCRGDTGITAILCRGVHLMDVGRKSPLGALQYIGAVFYCRAGLVHLTLLRQTYLSLAVR